MIAVRWDGRADAAHARRRETPPNLSYVRGAGLDPPGPDDGPGEDAP